MRIAAGHSAGRPRWDWSPSGGRPGPCHVIFGLAARVDGIGGREDVAAAGSGPGDGLLDRGLDLGLGAEGEQEHAVDVAEHAGAAGQ